jgi:hypothetical protein
MPPGGPAPDEAGKSLVLRYSDERHIARYEQQFWFLDKTYVVSQLARLSR